MADILVVVADRGRARLFSIKHGEEQLDELQDMVNPSLRVHAGDLAHERQGRSMSRNRSSRTAFGDNHFLKQESARRFARQVADAVESTCHAHPFERMFLLTEPEFLGLLRPCFTADKLGIPVLEIHKNITHRSTDTIRGYLPKHLWKRHIEGILV